MKYIVYCTTCIVNGKIYIGVHKAENPEIFDGYIGNGLKIGWNIKNPSTAFQHAVKKYGYSKFKRATLFVFDSEKEAFDKEAEIVDINFIKRRDNYNTALGGKYPGTYYKTLYQYDLQGNYITEWFSVEDTCKHFGCYKGRFNAVIKEKRSAFNSFWSYDKLEKLDITLYRLSLHSETYQYDRNGELINIFNNAKDIIKLYPNLTLNSISCARNKKVLLSGYYWVSGDVNIIDVIKTRELLDTLSDKSISKYKNGILVKTYFGLALAAKENNISSYDIKKSIKNHEGIWSYGMSPIYLENTNPIPIKVEQYDLEGNLIKVWDSIALCTKQYKNARNVLRGHLKLTLGYIFKLQIS